MRRRLLEAVEDNLAQGESFAEMSVERLANQIGISRSTFYVYFEDKGDVLSGWFEDVSAELAEVAAAWWSVDASATRADVQEALDLIVRRYQPHMPLMAAVYDTAGYDPAVQAMVEKMMGNNMAGLRKHLRVGQAEGFIDADLPVAETAAWLTWMAERGFHQLVRGATPAAVNKLINAYAAIVWNTLYAPARR